MDDSSKRLPPSLSAAENAWPHDETTPIGHIPTGHIHESDMIRTTCRIADSLLSTAFLLDSREGADCCLKKAVTFSFMGSYMEAFQFAGPCLWNNLPDHVRKSDSPGI